MSTGGGESAVASESAVSRRVPPQRVPRCNLRRTRRSCSSPWCGAGALGPGADWARDVLVKCIQLHCTPRSLVFILAPRTTPSASTGT